MIGSTRRLRVFAYAEPVDMRRSFNGLESLVTKKLGRDVLAGELFLFVSRRRKRAKVLGWDRARCLCEELERGCFTAPWRNARDGAVEMTVPELALFLEGSHLAGRVRLSPSPFLLGSVFAQSQKRD